MLQSPPNFILLSVFYMILRSTALAGRCYVGSGVHNVARRKSLLWPAQRQHLLSMAKSSEGLKSKPLDWDDVKTGSTLVIVESPAKAKTIQKFVDSDEFIVDSCAGHIRDLPRPGADFSSKADLKKIVVLKDLKLNVADLGVNVENNFEPVYVALDGKAETLKRLKKLSEGCSRILLATDEDREGEAISWHLVDILQPKVPYKRAVFHEITKGAIIESFENPRDIDMDLVQSQETRRILDRLAGYTISPVLWRYVAPGLSAGRVQSCGLFLITQRERKRWAFTESEYFSIRANFVTEPSPPPPQLNGGIPARILRAKLHSLDGQKVAGDGDFDGSTGELKVSISSKGESSLSSSTAAATTATVVLDKDVAVKTMSWLAGSSNDGIVETAKTVSSAATNAANSHSSSSSSSSSSLLSPPQYKIANTDTRKSSRKPSPPFITSTLQQECSRKLGLSPSRCMSVAQELYEEGYITYMRTDSPQLSATATEVAKSIVKSTFGESSLAGSEESSDAGSSSGPSSKATKGAKKQPKQAAAAEAPKNAQQAHEAIRPAESEGRFRTPRETGFSGSKLSLYSLIYRRTLAAVMKPSQSLTKTYTIETEAAGEEGRGSDHGKRSSSTQTLGAILHSAPAPSQASFRSSETVTTFKGFLAAYEMSDGGDFDKKLMSVSDSELPKELAVGQQVWLLPESPRTDDHSSAGAAGASVQPPRVVPMNTDDGDEDSTMMFTKSTAAAATAATNNISAADDQDEGEGGGEVAALSLGGVTAVEHITRPPARYTEASFVKELETIGVGRPSTYAKIFQILRDRGYVHVDRQTLIPTLKGLIVSEWLERHFPELVEPQFTASMEDSLDKIASGQLDKLDFLSKYYLGDYRVPDINDVDSEETQRILSDVHRDVGLLARVAKKLGSQEIDHKESRTLVLPFLKDLGVVQLGSAGAFIEARPSVVAGINNGNKMAALGEQEDNIGAEKSSSASMRWKLPEAMQVDLREVTKDAIERLMQTETSMQGASLGNDPVTGKPIIVRSGRYGKYAQVGLNTDKNMTTHSLPNYIDPTICTLDEIVDFIRLPKEVGIHPELHRPMIVEVVAKSLSVGVQGFPIRVALPDGFVVSQVTPELAAELLQDTEAILDSMRPLGVWNEEEVAVRRGRFGHYVKCGKLIAGLGKKDPKALTIEEAIELLQTRGKEAGTGKKGKKKTSAASAKKKASTKADEDSKTKKTASKKNSGKKTSTTSSSDDDDDDDSETASPKPKKLSGYQYYLSEQMRSGLKMKEAIAGWKLLDEGTQLEFKVRAASLAAAAVSSSGGDSGSSSGGGSKDDKKKNKIATGSGKKKSGASPSKRPPSGYQLFLSESLKGKMPMKDAVVVWKEMDEAGKQTYKDRAVGASTQNYKDRVIVSVLLPEDVMQ